MGGVPMKTSVQGLLFLMNKEGVVLTSYRDSVGVWTIGVGHTAAAGAPKPNPGLEITLERAVELFRKDVQKYEAAVNRAVTVIITQYQFDALVSFHYNTGGIVKARLTKLLNAGDIHKAGDAFMGWLKPASIIGRREDEQELFRIGNYGNISKVLVYPIVTDLFKPTGAKSMDTNDVLGAKPWVFRPSPKTSGTVFAVLGALLAAIAAFLKAKGIW